MKQVVQTLLDFGADCNLEDNGGSTALHMAAGLGRAGKRLSVGARNLGR